MAKGELSVGISQMVVSSDPSTSLVAAHLGSCVALLVVDPRLRLAGMAHCLLPTQSVGDTRSEHPPAMFVDTGVDSLLNEMRYRGAQKQRLLLFAAGGARMNDVNEYFAIGQKNIATLRKILWKNDLLMTGSELGGDVPRTLVWSPNDCSVRLRSGATWRQLYKGGQDVVDIASR